VSASLSLCTSLAGVRPVLPFVPPVSLRLRSPGRTAAAFAASPAPSVDAWRLAPASVPAVTRSTRGAGLRRPLRARSLPGSASGIPLTTKEPHVAEPREASNGEDT